MFHCIKIYCHDDDEFEVTYLDTKREYHRQDLESKTLEDAKYEAAELLDVPETAIEVLEQY